MNDRDMQTIETVLRDIAHGIFPEPIIEISTEQYVRIEDQVLHAYGMVPGMTKNDALDYIELWDRKVVTRRNP